MSENVAESAERNDFYIPCPFCGGLPVMRKDVEEYPADGEHAAGEYEACHMLCCDTCGIKLVDEYRDDVVAAWNDRAILPEETVRAFRLVEIEVENGRIENALDLMGEFINRNGGREDSQGMIDVLEERRRQVDEEGFDFEHDDKCDRGQLVRGALNYAAAASNNIYLNRQYISDDAPPFQKYGQPLRWPWDGAWWKPGTARRMLVKAAALIVAEIERLDRKGDAS